jgi:DNA mismatch repair protein MutS
VISVLYPPELEPMAKAPAEAPEYFHDLRLDRIVGSITATREPYRLVPFFWHPLPTVDAIQYRHEVFRDLEQSALVDPLHAFAKDMRKMWARLAHMEKLAHQRQRERWFLDAVALYCQAVGTLTTSLTSLPLGSRALRAVANYLRTYVESEWFAEVEANATVLLRDLDAIRYTLHIEGSHVTVGPWDPRPDYSATVASVFEKFRQGPVDDYRVVPRDTLEMNHIEAHILDLVARLFPEIFGRLAEFPRRYTGFRDATVMRFDQEIQWYWACVDYMDGFRAAGLPFSLPRIAEGTQPIYVRDGFDPSLGDGPGNRMRIVTNDFELRQPERVLVVTGPNQGGKTTFARMIGQTHYLSRLGCPVPGSDAQLLFFDEIFTHFQREEDIQNLRSRLEDELVRAHDILARVGARSIVIMNESFGGAALQDARTLGKRILERIIQRGALGVYVTFVDELSRLGPETVSMVADVRGDASATRTYKMLRRPSDGRAYALSIAKQYGLDYGSLVARLKEVQHAGPSPL